MKKLILLLLISVLVLPGCTKQYNVAKNDSIKKQTFTKSIFDTIQLGKEVKEISKVNLTIPNDIDEVQIAKYFQIDDIYFATVVIKSMNIDISSDKKYRGLLTAKKGDTKWEKYLEIEDKKVGDKNNPYYLWTLNKKLYLSVVDQNGAGSGEGVMTVLSLDKIENDVYDWTKSGGCYYFDQFDSNNYYASSKNINKQKKKEINDCYNMNWKMN